MGADGAQGVARLDAIRSRRSGRRYGFATGRALNVDASEVVRNGRPPIGAHSDIVHPELTWVVLAAGRISQGYPTDPSQGTRMAWLLPRTIEPAAVYVHRIGRTVEQVRAEHRLRDAAETYLDLPGSLPDQLSAVEAHGRVRSSPCTGTTWPGPARVTRSRGRARVRDRSAPGHRRWPRWSCRPCCCRP